MQRLADARVAGASRNCRYFRSSVCRREGGNEEGQEGLEGGEIDRQWVGNVLLRVRKSAGR